MLSKEQIQLIAGRLLPDFIPKDPEQATLTFHFTIPPRENYKVTFVKNKQDGWVFESYREDIL